MDRFIERFPGSVPTKAFVTAFVISIGLAYPAFGPKKEDKVREGHEYFSHDKPESIRTQHERMQRERRERIFSDEK